jgi:hypothetical protein
MIEGVMIEEVMIEDMMIEEVAIEEMMIEEVMIEEANSCDLVLRCGLQPSKRWLWSGCLETCESRLSWLYGGIQVDTDSM